ncbi:AraC family transcriptional regulator [Aeromonas taiwanensis]|uniref:AraC family transcriptional regulator n=1 Tax=Aeromonas taiwanensis TaxID=633417 RepID=UPI00207C7AFE|nr:AraC family transcriptional regulator [Aeromonas taiwanensis]MCO4204805.1 AraC family transcriptional regulator [Aeromonas taiwanensis]
MLESQLTTLHVVSLALEYLCQEASPPQQERSSAALLAHSGIEAADVHNNDARITRHQELTVCANGLSRCPDLGLRLGQRMHISAYGLLGYAAISSATQGEALQLMFAYPSLLGTYFHLQLRIEGDLAWICASDYRQREDLRRFNIEMCLASLRQTCSDLVGHPLPVRRAEFSQSETAYSGSYRTSFGPHIRYDGEQDAFAIDTRALATRLPLANPVTHNEMLVRCRKLNAEFNTRQRWLERVRELLGTQLSAPPRLEALADQMHCSARTLRRHLYEMGTNYQELLDELRFERAKQLLAEKRHAIYQIAEELGFSESASFRHAFQRWSGVPPSQFRH